jgi:hypothetical protein
MRTEELIYELPVAGEIGRPRKADLVFSRSIYFRLIQHMANGNEGGRFYHGFYAAKPDENGNVSRSWKPGWSKQANYAKKQAESWDTICGRRSGDEVMIGFAAKGQSTNQSTWGAMDFDGKRSEAERERAKRLAMSALAVAAADEDNKLILETSGSGGWHLYLIRRQPLPMDEWTRILKGIAQDIGTEIKPGICEIFPPDGDEDNECGTAIRAPGTYNASSGNFSMIVYETVTGLLHELTPVPDPSSWTSALCSGRRNNREEQFFSNALLKKLWEDGTLTPEMAVQVAAEIPLPLIGCEIAPGDRHSALKRLIGQTFPKIGRTLAAGLAEYFFTKSGGTPSCPALADHMREFTRCWNHMRKKFRRTLNDLEKAIYGDLTEESWQDAFRIIRNFAWADAKKADGTGIFSVSQRTMALRLIMSGAGVNGIIAKLVEADTMEKVRKHTHGKSAQYRWKANSRDALARKGKLNPPPEKPANEDPF